MHADTKTRSSHKLCLIVGLETPGYGTIPPAFSQSLLEETLMVASRPSCNGALRTAHQCFLSGVRYQATSSMLTCAGYSDDSSL